MQRRTMITGLVGTLGSLCVRPRAGRAGSAPKIAHVRMSDGVVIGLEAAGSGPSLLLVR